MIESIDKDYFTDELVQYMINVSRSDYMLVDADEIVFLRTNGEVIINKFLNNPRKDDFKFNDVRYRRPYILEWGSVLYNELFDYNKMYLKFEIGGDGYSFGQNYFLSDGSNVFCINEYLPLRYGEENTITKEISKSELESFLDSSNYDSMYMINREAGILFASSKKDGTVIDRDLILSDEDIIAREFNNRQFNQMMASYFSISGDHEMPKLKPKKIDEITEFSLYNKGMFHGYYHMLVTSKDGKFDVNWFGLDYISKDKYRLTLGSAPVIEHDIDYVSEFISRHGVSEAITPSKDAEYWELIKSFRDDNEQISSCKEKCLVKKSKKTSD